jgi:hypothetical protein
MNCFIAGVDWNALIHHHISPVLAPPSLQQHRSSLTHRYSSIAANTAHHSQHRSRHHRRQHRTLQPASQQAPSPPAPHITASITAGTVTASTAHHSQHHSRYTEANIEHCKHEQFNNASAPCNAGPFLTTP